MSARQMNVGEWTMLLALSLLWGASFLFNGIAVKALPPFTIVTLRVGLAALVLWALVRATGQPLPKGRKVWAAFFGMGLLNNVLPFCLIVWGQTQITGGLASILNATTPLFGVVVAHLLTSDEKMTGNRLAGVIAGFTGVAVMIGPEALSGLGTNVWAQAAVLAAALSYAFAGIFGRRFRAMGIAPMTTAAGQVTASTVLLLPVTLIVDRPWMLAVPGLEVWVAMAGIVLLSTVLAYILFFRILSTAGATNLMLVTFLIPVSAIVLGALVLGERLQLQHVFGMALIAIGLAAIDGRLWRRLRGSVAAG